MKQCMRWGAAILTTCLILSAAAHAVPVQAAGTQQPKQQSKQQTEITLKWNGKTVSHKGLLIKGINYIPVTMLRDAAGLPLSYNPGTRTYTLGSGHTQLNMQLTEYYVSSNVNFFYVDEYNVKNIGGRLYVPFKMVHDYLGIQGQWNAATKTINLSNRETNDVKIVTEKIEKTSKNAVYLLRYPKISGIDEAAQKEINKLLKEDAEKFHAASQAYEKERTAAEPMYNFLQNYVVTYNQNGIISIMRDQYSYLGGAHGSTYRKGFTFSLKDGKVLKLQDLGFDQKETWKKLSTKVGDLLKAREDYYGDDEALKEWGYKELDEDPGFVIKDDNTFSIFFQLYEYTPYASGFPTFQLSFSSFLPKGADPFGKLK